MSIERTFEIPQHLSVGELAKRLGLVVGETMDGRTILTAGDTPDIPAAIVYPDENSLPGRFVDIKNKGAQGVAQTFLFEHIEPEGGEDDRRGEMVDPDRTTIPLP